MEATWEERAQEAGCDDLSLQTLNTVHPERAHQILNDLSTKGNAIRNPSAFVSNAARKGLDDVETLRRALESTFWVQKLDDMAMTELNRVDATFALNVLLDVRGKLGSVRNLPAYVCSTLRKQMAEGKALGRSMGMPPASYGMTRMGMMGPPPSMTMRAAYPGAPLMRGSGNVPRQAGVPAFSGRSWYGSQLPSAGITAVRTGYGGRTNAPIQTARTPLPAPRRGIPSGKGKATAQDQDVANVKEELLLQEEGLDAVNEEEAEAEMAIAKEEINLVIAELAPDLDQRAVERIHELGTADEARSALEALKEAEEGHEVRNRSAFMHSIVNRRLQVAAEARMAADEVEQQKKAEAEEAQCASELEIALRAWGGELDDKARNALVEVQGALGAAVALQICEELKNKLEQGDLRNASSFATSMARSRLAAGPKWTVPDREAATMVIPMHRGQRNLVSVKEHEKEFEDYMTLFAEEIDKKAHTVLNEVREKLGTSAAIDIMKELEAKSQKEGIRNVSSFVFSMARQRLSVLDMRPAHIRPTPSQATGYMRPVPPPMSAGPPRQAPRVPLNTSTPMGSAYLQELLDRYPGLEGKLDDMVLKAMENAMPERLEEVLQDMSEKGNVRNPSAWIQKSLKDYPTPFKRGIVGGEATTGSWGMPQPPKRQRTESSSSMNLFEAHPDLMQRMDEVAVSKLLGHPDQNRVMDILAEMETKGDIRNPSAFVVRALSTSTW